MSMQYVHLGATDVCHPTEFSIYTVGMSHALRLVHFQMKKHAIPVKSRLAPTFLLKETYIVVELLEKALQGLGVLCDALAL